MKNYEFRIHITWLPDYNEQGLKEVFQQCRRANAAKKIVNHNFGGLPNRLIKKSINALTRSEFLRFGK